MAAYLTCKKIEYWIHNPLVPKKKDTNYLNKLLNFNKKAGLYHTHKHYLMSRVVVMKVYRRGEKINHKLGSRTGKVYINKIINIKELRVLI